MPWATVLRNAAFGLELRGVPRKEREAIAREYIAKMNLTGLRTPTHTSSPAECGSGWAWPEPWRSTPTSC